MQSAGDKQGSRAERHVNPTSVSESQGEAMKLSATLLLSLFCGEYDQQIHYVYFLLTYCIYLQ